MSWTITGVGKRGAVDNSTTSHAIAGTGDEIFVAFLGTGENRDTAWNTATFNGQNMTGLGVQEYINGTDECSIAGYYYDCKALPAGNYNFYRECTTGGPDDGIEVWFVIKRDTTTSSTTDTAVYGTELNAGVGTVTDNIAVSWFNSLVVSAYYDRIDGTLTTGAGQTDIVANYDPGNNNLMGASYKVANSGTATMAWTGGDSGDEYCQITFVVSPLHQGGGSFLINML